MSEKKDDKAPEKAPDRSEQKPRGEESPGTTDVMAEMLKTMKGMQDANRKEPALPDPELFKSPVPGGVYGIRNAITGRVDEYVNCHGEPVTKDGKPIEE